MIGNNSETSLLDNAPNYNLVGCVIQKRYFTIILFFSLLSDGQT